MMGCTGFVEQFNLLDVEPLSTFASKFFIQEVTNFNFNFL